MNALSPMEFLLDHFGRQEIEAAAIATVAPPTPETAKVENLPITTAAELAKKTFSLRYLIQGIMVEGQNQIIAGPGKSLKTNIALDQAISIASGTDFLGKFKVLEKRKVLFISGESGGETIKETAKRICEKHDTSLEKLGDDWVLCEEVPQIADDIDLARLIKTIQDHKFRVVFIDPAYFAIDGSDAGNLFSMGKQLRPLADACRELHCTPVIIHHTKRSSEATREFRPLELEDIAWAGFAEFARQWFLVNRRETYTPGTGSHKLWFSSGGSAGQGGLFAVDIEEGENSAIEGREWNLVVESASDAKAAAKDAVKARREAEKREREKESAEAVKRAFALKTDPLTQNDLSNYAGLSGSVTKKAIGYLLRIDEIEETTIVKNKREYNAFRLRVK